MRELLAAETARFVAERPRSMALLEQARRTMPRGVPMAWMDDLYDHPPAWVAHGEGSRFTDVDGHRYVDMYVADMSANAGFLLPGAGYHDALRAATRAAGTLLALDETHSLVCAYAGLTNEWDLEPDFLTLGKAIAAGVPLACYGMRDEIAALIAPPEEAFTATGVFVDEVATGGTLFANALSMAAGRPALVEVLTEEAFTRTAALGERMAAGLRATIAAAGLPWSVSQYGAHAAYFFVPEPPPDGAGSRAADDADLRALIRVFMANRGVWESGWWLGPTVSVAHAAEDVDRYHEVFEQFVAQAAIQLG